MVKLSASLGHATNNIGELYAFGIALSDILHRLDRLDHPPTWPAYLVTDSQIAHTLILGKAHPQDKHSTMAQVLTAVRRLWKRVKTRITPIIWKVASHTGVKGNEEVDAVAGRAAAISTTADAINLEACICSGTFAYSPI